MKSIPNALDKAKEAIKNHKDLIVNSERSELMLIDLMIEYRQEMDEWMNDQEQEFKNTLAAKNVSDNLFETIAQITKDHAKTNYNINL